MFVIGRYLGMAIRVSMAALLTSPLAGLTSAPADAADACPADAVCDSFEGYRAGALPGGGWTVERYGEPVIEVDDHQAYLGEKSVKIRAKGRETAFISLAGAPLFPLHGNVLFGRAMIKLTSTPEQRVHWTMIEGKGPSAEGGHVVEYRYGGAKPIEQDGVYQGSRLMANYETPKGPKTDCWSAAENRTVMPTGRWVCLAWMFDGPNNSMALALDGEPQIDLAVKGVGQGCMGAPDDYTWRAPVFDRINLGWETYKEDEPRTLWIDDVAISPRPLTCPSQ